MDPKELETQQESAQEGAAPTGASAGAAEPKAGTVAETTQLTPDIQEMIKTAVSQVREEYEAKGTGHISKLKSTYDRKVKELERQLNTQQQLDLEEAQRLMEHDPEAAAQILLQQVEALTRTQQQERHRAETEDWIRRITSDLGYDLEADEEAATWAAEWTDKLLNSSENLTWDFQQEAARKRLEAKDQEMKAALKELKTMKEEYPDLIRSEVARLLAGAGITPDATGEGGTSQQDDDWRELPAGKLVSQGLAARRKAPMKRT